jgi:opacity protein-like surface antigen
VNTAKIQRAKYGLRPRVFLIGVGWLIRHHNQQHHPNMKITLALAATLLTASFAQAGGNYAPATTTTAPTSAPKTHSALAEGFYIDLAGGAVFLQDSQDFSFDTGFSITGAVGMNLGNGLSVELESGYLTSDVEGFDDETEFATGSLHGDVSMVPILANVKYTAPVTSLFNFYVGAGLGALYTDSSVGIGPDSVSDSEWDFAFQGFAGVSVPMSEILNFDLGYRFLATGFNSDELRAHVVEAGISFKF